MGAFQFSHLHNVPNLLSLTRLPLAGLFVWIDEPVGALAILIAAGATDVIDGWYARRHDQTTATGAVVDPLTDKLFVAVVVITLWLRGVLSPPIVLALSIREIGELPMVAWLLADRRARREKADRASANVFGKLVTVLQFVTVCFALFYRPALVGAAVVTGVAGAVAAIAYWRQWLRR